MKFLKNIDQYLLRHYLHVWRTKAHYTLTISILAGLILFLIGYFYPLDMLKVGKNYQDIENIKQLSFLISAALAAFGIVAWWRQIAKYPLLTTNWRNAILENAIYVLCLFVIWEATNAFTAGLNANIVSLKNRISSEDQKRLDEENFFVPVMLSKREDIGSYKTIKEKNGERRDEFCNDSVQKERNIAINLFDYFLQRAKKTPYADSQFVINSHPNHSLSSTLYVGMSLYDYSFYRYKYGNGYNYDKVLEIILKRNHHWQQKDIDTYYEKHPYNSLYKELNNEDKKQIVFLSDSLSSIAFNEAIKKESKEDNFNLFSVFSNEKEKVIKNIIDTCDANYFKASRINYLKTANYNHFCIERDILKRRFLAQLKPNEKELYWKYLSSIIQSFSVEIHNRNRDYSNSTDREDLLQKEIKVYKTNDSLYVYFSRNITYKSALAYRDYVQFLQNNVLIKETELSEFKENIWNFRHNKYKKDKYFPTATGIDSIFKASLIYLDTLKRWDRDTIALFRKINRDCGNILPFDIKNRRNYNYYYYYDNYSTFDTLTKNVTYYYITLRKNEQNQITLNDIDLIKKKKHDISYYNRKNGKIDSVIVTPDSLFTYYIKMNFRVNDIYSYDDLMKPVLDCYKSNLSDPDSVLLRNVLQHNGFMSDDTYTFDREYLLSSSYYLQVADIQINKIRKTFFQTYDFLAMNKKVAFCIGLLALLLFVMTSVQSNFFMVLFASFFLVFFNFSIFKIVNALMQSDANMPIYLSFGVLAIFALVCTWSILFSKSKKAIVSTLLLIQMVSLLGIFLLIFKEDDIIRNFNYLAFYIGLLFVLTLFYRKYLSLPVRR